MIPLDRIVLRLFVGPAILVIGAFLIPWVAYSLSSGLGAIFPLDNQLIRYGLWLSGALLVASLVWGASSAYTLWQWWTGRGGQELCWRCGGLVRLVSSRRGGSYRCIGCGTKQ